MPTDTPPVRLRQPSRNGEASAGQRGDRTHGAFHILIETGHIEIASAIEAMLPEGSKLKILHAKASPPIDSETLTGPAFPIPELTARQREILPLLLQKLSNKQIGRSLGLSPFTVRNHVSLLLRSLEVPTRKAAIAKLGQPSAPDHPSCEPVGSVRRHG